MKRQKRYINFKHSLIWPIIILLLLSIITLFGLKDNLTKYDSNHLRVDAESQANDYMLNILDSAYNYNKNGLPYNITFLEFGAKGCSACKRMEEVMEEIKTTFPNYVNVVFIDVRLPEKQKIADFFLVGLIPTQVLLDRSGKEYFRHTGYYSVDSLKVKIK